jgi:hypothetical protein
MRLKTTKWWTEKRAKRKVARVSGRSEAHVRRCRMWTYRIGAAFLLNVILITPFFAGMPSTYLLEEHRERAPIPVPRALHCSGLYGWV